MRDGKEVNDKLFSGIDSSVICAIIAFSGTFASAFISWIVSRYTITKELEKLRLTWNREDSVSYKDEFSEMVSSVSKYIQTLKDSDCAEAVAKIGIVRSKVSDRLASCLDMLYVAVNESGYCQYPDVRTIQRYLSEAINQNRKSSRKTQ